MLERERRHLFVEISEGKTFSALRLVMCATSRLKLISVAFYKPRTFCAVHDSCDVAEVETLLLDYSALCGQSGIKNTVGLLFEN